MEGGHEELRVPPPALTDADVMQKIVLLIDTVLERLLDPNLDIPGIDILARRANNVGWGVDGVIERGAAVVHRNMAANPRGYVGMQQSDECILDVCSLLEVSRHQLNITGAPKGLFLGNLSIKYGANREWMQVLGSNDALSVNTACLVDGAVSVRSATARYIIVVEKEGIFRRLEEDGVCMTLNCIIITGCGMPDMTTRAFIKLLSLQLPLLPILCLTDYNPYGLGILQCYQSGSIRSPESVKYAVPTMKWLGLHAIDIAELHLLREERHIQQFSRYDNMKITHLLANERMRRSPAMMEELNKMNEMKVKVELEAVYSKGFNYFAQTFIRNKILTQQWI